MEKKIENEHVGKLIKITNQMFETYINNNLKKINLTSSQMNILIYICISYKKSIIVNQINIQDKFNLTNPTVTGILNRLEDKEFIKRVSSGRCNQIIPTELGIELIDSGYKNLLKMENDILSCLSTNEVNMLKEILTKIINNKMGEDIDDKKVS